MATYHDLFIQCPGCIREKGYDVNPPRQWYHASCGGAILIDENAYCRCVRCGDSSHIKHWRYACHINSMDDRPIRDAHSGSSCHFANAIAISGKLTNKAGTQWFLNLIANLGDDW